MNPYHIIKRPVITEKTTHQKETMNKVGFEVADEANRIEIKKAVEKIFNVRVSNVRTMHVNGKTKRRGLVFGKRRDWKKAIVTLMPGERIAAYEGA